MNETGRGLFPWEDERTAGRADTEPPAVEPDATPDAGAGEETPEPATSGPDAASADSASPEARAGSESLEAPAERASSPEAPAGRESPAADGEPPSASQPDAGGMPPAAAAPEGVAVADPAADLGDATPPAQPGPAAEPADRAAARRPEPGQRHVVRKEYYSISEVAEIVGLPAHVLRYWETQFSLLNPSKNRSGNRVYQRKEIKLILLVKQLLHDEKYTVEGARQKLDQLRRGGGIGPAAGRALDEQLLHVLREDLHALGQLLRTDNE
jgi:DNA-binding transcriptional MerR regulator